MPPPIAAAELPFEVLRLSNALVRGLGSLTARHGLTPQQAGILFRLASLEKPPTLAGLGRSLSVSKQNITGMVTRLAEAGLVRREEDPSDMRASRLTLTRKGSDLAQKLRPAVARWTAGWLEDLGEQERTAAAESLARLLAGVER
ncbi:MAG TPA: MarR family transcriptional regulator [Thermoanaerobaculia bacterium]|nr:MarR family transcriptional regulator [Thermoanaerobaculia bacterium]